MYDRRCATFGHNFTQWMKFPVIPEFLVQIRPEPEPVAFNRVRYVAKRECRRCGYVEKDMSNA